MKRINAYSTWGIIAGFALLAFVPSCGSSSSDGIAGPTTSNTGGTTTATVKSTAKRECSNVISGVSEGELTDFIQPEEEITNLEGDVTGCLTASRFRVEFEVDAGIFYIEFTKPLYYKSTSTTVEAIFQDGFGLVGIKGSKSNATISYYNFPSFDQAVEEAIEEVKKHCGKGGDWTVAKCNGYGPPVPWWNDPLYTTSNKVSKAKADLADSSKSSTLGSLSY